MAKTAADGGYGPLGLRDNDMKEFIRELRGYLEKYVATRIDEAEVLQIGHALRGVSAIR